MRRKPIKWQVKRVNGCLEIRAGAKLVARCYTQKNACLIVSAPIMRRALAITERVLLKNNRHKDGSQRQNTDACMLLVEHVLPALEAARGQHRKNKAGVHITKRRPHHRASLPV